MNRRTTGKVLRYTLMPEVLPRARALGSGFHYISFFMAQIYSAVRLLPDNHPYLSPANMGRFGLRQVIAEAGLILKSRKNQLDQVVIYWLLMSGMVILLLQFCLLGAAMFTQTAKAFGGENWPANIFATENPNDDLAFIMMDRVFGVPDLFNSCVAQGIVCLDQELAAGEYWVDSERTGTASIEFPYPYHRGLQTMLQLYSIALLVIGMFILIYFIGAILAETAQSGTPFGKRFNHVWAPVRLVVAMGLLIPVANGLNSAQYITLYAAKFGSSFATNGWNLFVRTAIDGESTILGDPESLVAIANAPPVNDLMMFFSAVSTCAKAYADVSNELMMDEIDVQAYLINVTNQSQPRRLLESVAFGGDDGAAKYFNNENIIVRFGHYDTRADDRPIYPNEDGNVKALCGELVLPMTVAYDEESASNNGALVILERYYDLIKSGWQSAKHGTSGDGINGSFLELIGEPMVLRHIPIEDHDENAPRAGADELAQLRDGYAEYIASGINDARQAQARNEAWFEDLQRLGWAGAGIWYNKIAQLNGSLLGALHSLPSITKMPEIMEDIHQARQRADVDVTGCTRYQPYISPSNEIPWQRNYDAYIGRALYHSVDSWCRNVTELEPTTNVFIDAINFILGTEGLFNIHQNAEEGVHPLAQIVAIGRGMMDSAIRNLGYAGVAAGVSIFMGPHMSGIGMAASGFLTSAAFLAISIGFILYYVVPFLPFIYFFFAVGNWVKGIFEAMVGVPLWALAHLRIDGQGLPGDAAMTGYYLILEIFLRPILIIFGMLAGISIFSAQAIVLHEIWQLVTSNLTGFDASSATDGEETGAMRYLRNTVDQIFFTVIYAIIIYMLGMSSFKLVDLIPNHILRWMGANVQTFGDQSGDAAENLVRNAWMGSNTVSSEVGTMFSGAKSAARDGVAGIQSLTNRLRSGP